MIKTWTNGCKIYFCQILLQSWFCYWFYIIICKNCAMFNQSIHFIKEVSNHIIFQFFTNCKFYNLVIFNSFCDFSDFIFFFFNVYKNWAYRIWKFPINANRQDEFMIYKQKMLFLFIVLYNYIWVGIMEKYGF